MGSNLYKKIGVKSLSLTFGWLPPHRTSKTLLFLRETISIVKNNSTTISYAVIRGKKIAEEKKRNFIDLCKTNEIEVKEGIKIGTT